MKYIVIKDWAEHQHYKNRLPPWIKLKTDVIEEFNVAGKSSKFYALSDQAKLCLMLIWVLGSKYEGSIPCKNIEWLRAKLGVSGELPLDELEMSKLIKIKSRIASTAASRKPKPMLANVLATHAREEGETEGETEGEKKEFALAFGPDEIQLLWNAERMPDWPACMGMNPIRKSHCIARLNEYPGVDEWRKAIAQFKRDPWWLNKKPGDKHSRWRPSFDYLIKPGTILNLLEKCATWGEVEAQDEPEEENPYIERMPAEETA